MKIVIDTTVLYQDWRFDKPTSIAFLSGLQLIPAKLHVPEIVLDEAERGFRRKLSEARSREGKEKRTVAKMLGATVEEVKDSTDQDARDYRTFLHTLIEEHGGEVLSYPDVDHRTLVRRDLDCRKPFKQSGEGYRDALIWETVRRLAILGPEQVIFVSNNIKDFGHESVLHPELRNDVEAGNVELVRDLTALYEDLVRPKLKMLEGVRSELQRGSGVVDLTQWVQTELADLIRAEEEEIPSLIAGFPRYVGSASLSDYVKLEELRVETVQELSEKDLLITFYVSVGVSINLSVSASDFAEHEEVREWAAHDEDSVYFSHDLSETLGIGIKLAVDKTQQVVESAELTDLDGPLGSISYLPRRA